MDIERRCMKVELRADTKAGVPIIRGMAAMFNSMSEDLGGFREQIAPGAFKRAVESSDIRALFNHDANMVLGRTTSGTLRVMETDAGLEFEVDMPDTTYARDLMTSMKRGDINQCSFGFSIGEGGDTWEKDSAGNYMRTIRSVERLYDVSPVTYPAYPETKCATRSLEKLKETELNLTDVLAMEHRKLKLQFEEEVSKLQTL